MADIQVGDRVCIPAPWPEDGRTTDVGAEGTVRELPRETRRGMFHRRQRPATWHVWLGVWAVLLVAASLLLTSTLAHAEGPESGYTASDTIQAIQDASDATGVPASLLTNTMGCETGWTFYPYSVGLLGEEGPAQIYPAGNAWPVFMRDYSDPFNPYEAAMFMARAFRGDYVADHVGPHSWSCF